MARTPYKDRLAQTLGIKDGLPPAMSPSESPSQYNHQPPPEPQSNPTNQRRRDAAHKHLDRMFSQAEEEQIDGRKFYGTISVRVKFENGVAQQVLVGYDATDRVTG